MSYIWPIALVIISNIIYQVSAKETPQGMNPFASLTITYLVGAFLSAILYFLLNKDANLLQEYSKANWASYVLGLSIVGLEAGYIYAYKAGWPVSTALIVQSVFVTIALLYIGYLVYHESLTVQKLVGVVICLIGLYILNK